MIELDTLLTGTPSWEEIAEFFKYCDFHEEHYLVAAIRKHLLTQDDGHGLFARDLTIEDALNGRYTGDEEPFVLELFKRWNEKLGFKHFMEE